MQNWPSDWPGEGDNGGCLAQNCECSFQIQSGKGANQLWRSHVHTWMDTLWLALHPIKKLNCLFY